MALFKLSVAYEGRSSEEIVEVEAKNSAEARRACEELVIKNKERMEWLTSRNVYDSRIVRSCELCPFDFRIDVIAMSDSLKSDMLKDDV